ncbi:DNA polymerase III subunit delta' [Sphingosinicella sp. LHD-64]|uniref:DNA polymerase III subunit delta' n=1 Tax=Sphingosinicella sp. LHD-64 TaxID=3072139 RepID=UPI00280DDF4D|nr:DNA polymerase III subunit delta' [Sphingosinicella sp. LHD-64]MDQ8754799.1 DNA polymerase III subunit delta' [Sphingosinicella sp. LHD-64]
MTPLHGHESAVTAFRTALDSGRLHHAWLIAGRKGIGKALFADKTALRVLAEGAGSVAASGIDVPDDHPTAKLVAAGSHPDLMRLERLTRENGIDLARSITVDQVRGLQRLFTTTSSLSPWRAVVIDAIDDLETAGANALLKNLEEPPPNTVFLLVSHAPERLLPTIRSRCRVLRLSPLKSDAMASALRAAIPDADEEEILALTAAGEGAPGRAVAWRGLDIDALDRDLEALVRDGDPANARRAALAQALAPKSAQARYEVFLERAPQLIAATARNRTGPALADALAAWERARNLAMAARRLSLDPASTVFELAGLVAALAPGSDRRAA